MALNSLAVVLPRWGSNLGGGAETLVAGLVQQLAPRCEVEVWTTCAANHRTWANHYPAGIAVDEGFQVRRFRVDDRQLDRFIPLELQIQEGRRLSLEEQLVWLESGVNSRGLYEHIARCGGEWDYVLFAPYLFPTSFWGALLVPERALLLPCLHDECYAYLEVFRRLMHRVRGVIFNSDAEARLAAELYGLEGLTDKSGVVGMGFDAVERANAESCSPEVRVIAEAGDYLLYIGRKEEGKNLGVLAEYFRQAAEAHFPQLKLVVIGSGSWEAPAAANIIDLGFVSSAEKALLVENAVVLCQPSQRESFSIVLFEAWLRGTPVLVHAQCAVTREHVVRSGGGLYFGDCAEFTAVVKHLLAAAEFRDQLGISGAQYVRNNYSWEDVLGRFHDLIQRIEGSRPHAAP